MWPVSVVLIDEHRQNPFDVLLVQNQTRVETFRADRTHEPRGNPVGLRRATRCPNDLNRVASEYVINWPPRDSNPRQCVLLTC